jgi:hypothetical protein
MFVLAVDSGREVRIESTETRGTDPRFEIRDLAISNLESAALLFAQ